MNQIAPTGFDNTYILSIFQNVQIALILSTHMPFTFTDILLHSKLNERNFVKIFSCPDMLL